MRTMIGFLVLFFVCCTANAEVKKYKAVVTVLSQDYDGYVYLDLEGENKGLIRIDEMSNGKLKNSLKINAALVSKVVIDNDTFYREDLEDTYDSKGVRKMNCYLKKICGNNDILLFEWEDKKRQLHYYFKLPEDDVASNIDHPYYTEWTINFYEGFKGCKNIYNRFTDDFDKKEKYPIYNMNTENEKVIAWKKVINEYDECLAVKK